MRKVFASANRAFHYLATLLLLALMCVVLTSDAYPVDKHLEQHLGILTAGKRFDLVGWEASALMNKARELIVGTKTVEDPSQFVRDFFDLASQIQSLRDQAQRLSKEEPVPEDQLAQISEQLDALIQERDAMQQQAEAILAAQVTQALQAEGLQSDLLLWSTVWPPVTSTFTDLPLLLVVSPRDKIARRADIYLVPNMTVAQMEALEDAIHNLNYSALVTGLGGLSTYPAMIPDIYGLGFVLDTMPHEWTHDFLGFHPLGWHYADSGQLTTMNETLADIVGSEVGQWMARAYYPEYVRQPTPTPAPTTTPEPTEPPAYDFGTEMRKIRLHVDDLLAQGQVDEAEAYMEEQRQILAEHGYFIRKLNQAYFAFHGSYATGPVSIDPIGPQLEELRTQLGSLRDFLFTTARMSSYDDLLRALGLPSPTPTPEATPTPTQP